VLGGEQEEYLNYFPEDRHLIEPYVDSLHRLLTDMLAIWMLYHDIESQKDFAIAVKDYPYSAVLFQLRKEKDSGLITTFNRQREEFKIKLLQGYVTNA
jgi:hypothetical protein